MVFWISSLLTALMVASQCNFMQQLSQELHKTLEKTFQRSPALFRVSALHLSVCHRSLDVSKYPMDEAECQNFNIFFI